MSIINGTVVMSDVNIFTAQMKQRWIQYTYTTVKQYCDMTADRRNSETSRGGHL
jgi:hypothetical protein